MMRATGDAAEGAMLGSKAGAGEGGEGDVGHVEAGWPPHAPLEAMLSVRQACRHMRHWPASRSMEHLPWLNEVMPPQSMRCNIGGCGVMPPQSKRGCSIN
jgi:hypothetical protein